MVASALSLPSHAAVFLLLIGRRMVTSAFQIPIMRHPATNNAVCPPIRMGDGDGAGDVVLYSDDDVLLTAERKNSRPGMMSRWDSLNPKIKSRIVKEAHERAIRNKKRREPASEKKRRLYDQYREMQVQSKRDLRVERATPVNSKSRAKLLEISPGDVRPGRVISLTRFGAYVDVNTEVDGLLHVSQITRDEFVDHPRRYLSPGDEVEVRVVRIDPETKKLQLTMLPEEVLEEENVMNKHAENEGEDDRIQLDEIEVDDELWGEIRRVTDYGAYVEIGAVCRGFLHFMDHPVFGEVKGSHPREYMRVGDRVRVWVLDVERTQKRIKLTANRPAGLPGPRREVKWI
ncbi:hypothetical protein ACHAW5_003743 [Stephanodiscus triporus]|uniref:S1 motif domain-containing protein n=1 Tax=Stephanodiscus triporus TaxID=2934178 RepID=A0ABD3NMS7_9STRA